MTIIFQDGFESGDQSAWNGGIQVGAGGTVTFVNSPIHHGSWAMKGVTTAGINDYAKVTENFGGAYGTVYARVYFRYNTAIDPGSAENVGFITLGDWNGSSMAHVIAGYGIYTAGGTGAYSLFGYRKNGGYAGMGISGGVPSINTWHYLEIMATIDAINGAVKCWLDGNTVADSGFKNDDYGNPVTLDFGKLRYATGYYTYDYNDTMYGDCAVVADQYIGPEIGPVMVLTNDMVFIT